MMFFRSEADVIPWCQRKGLEFYPEGIKTLRQGWEWGIAMYFDRLEPDRQDLNVSQNAAQRKLLGYIGDFWTP